MKHITAAQPSPDYRLKLRFDDGVEGVVNLSAEVGKGIGDHYPTSLVANLVGISFLFNYFHLFCLYCHSWSAVLCQSAQ